MTNIDDGFVGFQPSGTLNVRGKSARFSGLAAVKRLGLKDRIRLLTPPLQKNEIYHFLHEKHRDLIPKVEQVLSEMQSSGELERLRKQIVESYLAKLDGSIPGK